MGRTVVGDAAQVELHADSIYQKGSLLQVGVLVGKFGLGASRDLVFALVPTPVKDGEETVSLISTEMKGHKDASARKGKKSNSTDSASLHIGIEWLAEHARQVARMLLGGMQVVGIFVSSGEGTLKNSMPTLWQAVKAVAQAVPSKAESRDSQEYLLLHICSSPRKLTCWSCSKDSVHSSSSFRPCDWKLGKIIQNLQEFSCTYSLNTSIPVFASSEGSTASLRKSFFSAINAEAARLKSAQAVVDGSLVNLDAVLGLGNNSLHTVQMLLPIDSGAHSESQNVQLVGMVNLRGNVQARAYGVVRDPLSRAVADLKGDIITSLKTRLELLVDEAEQAVENCLMRQDSSNKESTPQHSGVHAPGIANFESLLLPSIGAGTLQQSFVMPRRVFVSWYNGAQLCDYILPNEAFEDVQDRCAALFGVNHVELSNDGEIEMLATLPTERQVALDAASRETVYALPFIGFALILILSLVLGTIWMQK